LVCSAVLNVALSVEILRPSAANSDRPNSVIPPQLEKIIQRLPPEDSKRFKAALGHHIPATLANRVRADELSVQSLRLIQAELLDLPSAFPRCPNRAASNSPPTGESRPQAHSDRSDSEDASFVVAVGRLR
jgi:hypothetical protein